MTQVVSIEFRGATLVEEELNASAARGGDMMGIWPAITERFIEIEEEQYETKGGRSGRRWKELSQPWLWYKFQHSLNLEIGKATGDTFEELTTDPVLEEGPLSITFGATTDAFRIQQSGEADPVRYPIDLTPVDIHQFTEAIMLWVTRGINRRGQRIGPAGQFAGGSNVL